MSHILVKLHFLLFSFVCFATRLSAQSPTSNFTADTLAGCSPIVVDFQDLSTGNPISWSWDFGNGNTSSLQNPTATYFTPGLYTVKLVTANASGSNTLIKTQFISVYEAPNVIFTASSTVGCYPFTVKFTDQSNGGTGNTNVTWEWDFGDGTTSNLQSPTFTYTSAGVFTVTLKVTNDKGCSRTLSQPNYISVTTGVNGGFNNTQPTVCSAPASINFTNSSTGPGTLTYLWDFGDGTTSNAQDPVHTYTVDGVYTPVLIATSSSGCEDTVVAAAPIAIGGIATDFTGPDSVCVNATTTFTNTSVPLPGSASWNFGDGGTASQINATHVYTSTGTYTVKLSNINPLCNDSISKIIEVVPGPVANFTTPDSVLCQPPLSSSFQNQSTGAVSWQWDFGDGTSSSAQNPVHSYTDTGTYSVKLIAANAFGCTDTLIKSNFVRIKKAVITIPALPAHGCIPYTLTMVPTIVSVDAVTSYRWDFGDGGTSTAANPTHTFATQGSYNVQLIITTSTGCQDTLLINNAVRVGTKPNADFSAAPIPVCTHQPVQFTDLSAPAVDQWLWDFGDGRNSTVKNPSHIYLDTGHFTVTLISSNSGCPDTMTKVNYTYSLPPIARFAAALGNCANRFLFNFTDQSIVNPSLAPLTRTWNFGDGSPLSNAQNPSHSFAALGSYPVTLIVSNGGCSDTITQSVEALDQAPDFTASATTFCRGTNILFTPSNYDPLLTTSLYWDAGTGPGGAGVYNGAVSYIYPNSGTYTVSLVTTDINGCKDTILKPNYIRVNGPLANFNATNVSGCRGITTAFNDLSTTDGLNAILNWRWNFGDGTIQDFTGPPFQHTYDTVGSFTVILIVTDAAGCSDSLRRLNLVKATDPIPNFTSVDSLTCPGAVVKFTNTSIASPPFTSQWDFGDGATSGGASPTHSYIDTGFYTIKLLITDQFGCADSITKNQYIHVSNPIANFTMGDSVSSCTPLQVQFTNTSTYFTSSFWDFGPGGSSIQVNPAHFFNTPGTYPVKLVVTSPGGCKDSISRTIIIYDTAGSVISYPPLNGCKPLSGSFTVFSPGPMSGYIWDFGDGTSVTTTVPAVSHIYNTFGNFVPKVILQDPSGCLIPVTGIDTVRIIGVEAKFGLDKNLLCDNGTVNFTDSTTFNDPIATMNWDFGDGGTSTSQNPSHDYLATGFYDVTLMVESLNGCRDTATILNAVKVVNSPVIGITGDSVICVNSALQNSGVFLQTDTAAVTWSWNFPNGNGSTLQNPLAQVYTSPGNFAITAIATNSSGCKDTAIKNILVNALPTVNMPPTLTVQESFPALIPATYPTSVVSWAWTPANGLSCTDCPAPTAGPTFTTDYQVVFTDSNGCRNTAFIQVIVICAGSNLFIPNTFSPNGDGSNDVFYPRGAGLGNVRVLRIFNRWGQVVFERLNFQANDALSGWDGKFKGNKPQPDVYVYQAEVFCANGEIIRVNGNIALIL